MARVALDRVVTAAGGHTILNEVTFSAEEGELVGLIGPSGAGKTSIIRAIAGFDPVTSGSVHFDSDNVTGIPTRERDVGIVTEEDTLFPTHSVRRNLSFPLWRLADRQEARKRVQAESRALNIDHILDRWPDTLSGGEQKLTQIARALVRLPRVFLMDQPLANLDPQVRSRLREELVVLQKGYGVTMIYASNSPSEIMQMPDRIVAVETGCVVQIGTPAEIHRNPASRSIANLTGSIGLLAVSVEPDGDGYWLTGDGIRLRVWSPLLQDHVGRTLTLGARSGDVHIDDDGPIRMTAGPVVYEEFTRLRELQSGAGTISTNDDMAEHTTAHIRLDRWHLFDDKNRRIFTHG